MSLEIIEVRHAPLEDTQTEGLDTRCVWCLSKWPCDASVLLARLEAVKEWADEFSVEAIRDKRYELDRILQSHD